jgi:L-2,4-diaminobutyrate decarboxylase
MSLQPQCTITINALERFLGDGREGRVPVLRQMPMAQLARELDIDRLIAGEGLTSESLRGFLGAYLEYATHLDHPAYMGHQVAVPHPLAVVAGLVDAATNNPMAIYEMGPSAATVEFAVLNWMLAKVGWRPMPIQGTGPCGEAFHGGGVLTHGGSLANLTALAAIRAQVSPNAWAEGVSGNLVIIAPAGCHYSINRAAGILGLGSKAVIDAPTDAHGRMIHGELGPLIDRIRSGGAEVMAVVANAGSTAVGLYDHIGDIAKVCRPRSVWLHVDGAHGASALASRRHRSLLDGIELADSLVWDAHKMMRTPGLCAAVLVRDHRVLDGAFQEEASYLFHDKEQPGFDFIHRTVECTKAALGLKAFLALAAEGEEGLARYIDRQTQLANEAAILLGSSPGFEVAVEPQSNIVCFRLYGDDRLQLDIRKRLVEKGDWYVSCVDFRGKRWLRLVLMSPETTIAHIRTLITEIRSLLHVMTETGPTPPSAPNPAGRRCHP